MRDLYIVCCQARDMLYLLSTLSVMYILLMYYISLLLLPPDGFVLCYIGLLVLTLWRFDDDIIIPSPGKGHYSWYQSYRVRILRPGFGHVVHSACSTSIHAICHYKEI